MKIAVVKNDHAVKRILSEGIIIPDFIDFNRVQDFDDFKAYKNLLISYFPEDFLIVLSDNDYEKLITENIVNSSSIQIMGWYNEKCNRVNHRIYLESSGTKFSNFINRNPELRITSFDKFRAGYYDIKLRNVLAGAFGLSHFCFRKDYENFFSKFRYDDDSWTMLMNDFDSANDMSIVMQLLCMTGVSSSREFEFIKKTASSNAVYILLSSSKEYFIENDYNMSSYLEWLAEEFNKHPELSPLNLPSTLGRLNEEYVKKGILPELNKFAEQIKNFLDSAQSEEPKLREFLAKEKGLTKTVIFLLGMLYLGDRLEEQFEFGNEIFAFTDMFIRYVTEIKMDEKSLTIHFDSAGVNGSGRQNYESIRKYMLSIKRRFGFERKITDQASKIDSVMMLSELAGDLLRADADRTRVAEHIKLTQSKIRTECNELKHILRLNEDLINGFSEIKNLLSIKDRLLTEKERLNEEIKEARGAKLWKLSNTENRPSVLTTSEKMEDPIPYESNAGILKKVKRISKGRKPGAGSKAKKEILENPQPTEVTNGTQTTFLKNEDASKQE